MVDMGIIEEFDMGLGGELLVPTMQPDGEIEKRGFDLCSLDPNVQLYLAENIWPDTKIYSFAHYIKLIAAEVFNIPAKQVYGSNVEKESLTQYNWEDMPGLSETEFKDESGPISVRDFLKYFGTEICRKIYSNVFAEATMRQIQSDNPKLALICDGRFPEELDIVHENGGEVIGLTLRPFKDSHISENADIQDKIDVLIDNSDLTQDEKNKLLYQHLKSAGLVQMELTC